MSTFYFTFMGKQHDVSGRSLARYYTTIEAEDEIAARRIYFNKYGDQFFTSYDEDGFAGQAETYGLRHIDFDSINLCCGKLQEDIIAEQQELEQST